MVLSWKLDLWKGFVRNSVYPKMYCQVATSAFAVRSLLPQIANIDMCTFISFAHNGTSLAKMSDTILYKDVSKLKVLNRDSLAWNCGGKIWIQGLVLCKWKMKLHCNNMFQTLKQHDTIRSPSYFLVLFLSV